MDHFTQNYHIFHSIYMYSFISVPFSNDSPTFWWFDLAETWGDTQMCLTTLAYLSAGNK